MNVSLGKTVTDERAVSDVKDKVMVDGKNGNKLDDGAKTHTDVVGVEIDAVLSIVREINETGPSKDIVVFGGDDGEDPFSGIDDADLLAYDLDAAVAQSAEAQKRGPDEDLGGGCVDDDDSDDDESYEYEGAELKSEYIAKIESCFDQLHYTRDTLGILIREGLEFFPDDTTFDDYQQQLDMLFVKEDSTDEEDRADIAANAEKSMYQQTLRNDTVSAVTPKKLEFGSEGGLSGVTPPTERQLGVPRVDVCNPLASGSGKDVGENDKGISGSLVYPRRASTRQTNPGNQMRSPFMKRMVTLDLALTADEKKAHEYCLSALGGPDDLLYSSTTGQRVLRAGMESLAAREHIFTNVIDGWVDILNYEERYRCLSSPRRLFFKTSVMQGGVLLDDEYSFERRYDWFSQNMLQSVNNNLETIKMRNIDLVFFPMMQDRHYYCVVFNLRRGVVEILDNRRMVNSTQDLEEVYGSDVNILHTMFTRHMKESGHTLGKTLEMFTRVVLSSIWQTSQNFVDCGVFLMRHMECYMGAGSRGWASHLEKEGASKKKTA